MHQLLISASHMSDNIIDVIASRSAFSSDFYEVS